MLEDERNEPIEVSRDSTLDWAVVREAIKAFGMRNSNCMAIAPTASTSNIVSAVPSIEPIYKNIYVESNISGDFTVVNPYLVEDLKKINLWNDAILNELKYNDGSVARVAGIPEHIKNKYKEVFEIDMRWLVRSAAYRAKWIDQSQSLNIFFRGSSGRELSEVYFYAWKMGLKTTYYLRTLAATQVEKSTVSTQQYGSTHKRDEGASMATLTAAGLDANAFSGEVSHAAPFTLESIPLAPVQPELGGVGAAIAPQKYVLHRAPEVTCESCQ
jgi:ribonucleoside-diphosphate reductase alpha chain